MQAEAMLGFGVWRFRVRPWRWCTALAVLVGMAFAGGFPAAGHHPVVPLRKATVAAPGGGLEVLSRLPVQAQSVISTTVGAGDPRFAPRPWAGGVKLYGGGVAVGIGREGVTVRAAKGLVSVSLSGVGRDGRLRGVETLWPPMHLGQVVYVRRGGVVEWYRAGPLGIEQGFTLARRPTGSPGLVTLAMRLGGLRARLSHPGLEFLARSGAVALRYGGLVAFDASGRRVAAWLSLSGSRLLLNADDRGARYPLRIDPFIQQGSKLTASDESGAGQFGASVALSEDGNTALIGGPIDNNGAGAAWVFARSGSTWTQQGPKLTGSGESGSAGFGASVALSGDGNTALIGGDQDNSFVGAAWVFARSGSTWTQQGSKLTASDETGAGQFGASVALSADGNTALIGGVGDNGQVGAAWVFTHSSSTWTQQGAKLTGAGESGTGAFGSSVALSGDGNTALIGARTDNNSLGAAWVFTRSGSSWTQQGAKLTGSGESGTGAFGWSVALSGDGNTALIGGPVDNSLLGAAWVFTRSGSTWTQQDSKLTAAGESGPGAFGWSVALSAEGNSALIGGPSDGSFVGAAWAFTRSGSTWTQQGSKLTGSGESGDGGFGIDVGLPGGGCTALIGGSADNNLVGAAWVFVDELPPAITSPASARFQVGRAGSFMVTTSSACAIPSLRESGALPAGVSFKDSRNGTAILSGIPAVGSGGIYHLTTTASNGVLPDATQSFTLAVEAPPKVVIKTPKPKASYTVGHHVASSFSCAEGAGGPGIASCLDQHGRPSGAPLGTA
ncbi:MAG: hypothetical protein JO262_24020, partial [Solirubrobacterales bacterium]|nr:hypothetical protein [Solirubrobacterales bacterium]